jgi:hypothetical protein
MDEKLNSVSAVIDNSSNSSLNSHDSRTESSKMTRGNQIHQFGFGNLDTTTVYLEKVRDNPNNCRCADCNSEDPTIAIISWLLVICKKCAGKLIFKCALFFMVYISFL